MKDLYNVDRCWIISFTLTGIFIALLRYFVKQAYSFQQIVKCETRQT